MTVVVGVDGSPHGRVALAWALDEARRRRAVLRVVHAWGMPSSPAGVGHVPVAQPLLYAAAKRGAQNVLDRELGTLPAVGVDVEPLLVEAPPLDALLDAARDADLLVVGSRGHGTMAQALLGSVGLGLVHNSRCPLAIVPRGSRAA